MIKTKKLFEKIFFQNLESHVAIQGGIISKLLEITLEKNETNSKTKD